MRPYALPEGLWLSFFSIRYYQSVCTWRSRSLAYLFLILALCWIPEFVQMHRTFHLDMNQMRSQLNGKVPEITIVHGEVHTPEAKPYALSFDRAKDPWLLIDTSQPVTSILKSTATIFISKDKIAVRRSPHDIRLYDLSRVHDMAIDNAMVQRILDKVEFWTPFVVYPITFELSYVKRFFQAFGLALVGLLIALWIDVALSLASLLSLAIVALTPEMATWTALQTSGELFRGHTLVLGAIAVGYFLFAVNAATDTPRE